MKIIFTLCTCIITILFFSCQREPLDVLPDEETPPPVDPATCVLDTFQIEMTAQGQSFLLSGKKPVNFTTIQYVDSSDDNYKILDSLVYDNQKRIKAVHRTSFAAGNNYASHSLTEITYNSQGNINKKIHTSYSSNEPTKIDSLIASYNYTNNKLTSIVRRSPFRQYTLNYASPETIIDKTPYVVEDSLVIGWTSDNITTLKAYSTYFLSGVLQFDLGDDLVFEYDLTKTNPFSIHTTFMSSLVNGYAYSIPSVEISLSSKNLIKKIVNTRGLTDPDWEDMHSYTYTYTFNNKGEISKLYIKSDSNLDIQEHSYTFSFFPKCQ